MAVDRWQEEPLRVDVDSPRFKRSVTAGDAFLFSPSQWGRGSRAMECCWPARVYQMGSVHFSTDRTQSFLFLHPLTSAAAAAAATNLSFIFREDRCNALQIEPQLLHAASSCFFDPSPLLLLLLPFHRGGGRCCAGQVRHVHRWRLRRAGQ